MAEINEKGSEKLQSKTPADGLIEEKDCKPNCELIILQKQINNSGYL